jgi:hypothetical protein
MRKPTRAHVPPQVAGNTPSVLRAPDVIDARRSRRPGTWNEGGMWVRGLCYDCNHLSGRAYDWPYADFAAQVGRLSTPIATHLQVIPGEPPGVFFAPGLVARCVLYGMFAINPRLRIIFPSLAYDLVHEQPPGHGPVRWPDQLTLRVARTHPAVQHRGLLSSGIWSMRLLTERVVHFPFADIAFRPLIWSLVPADSDSERDGLGPQVTKPLADASDWINYGPDRTAVDLRSLTRTFPAFWHPMFTDRRDWSELMTRDGSDADAVVIFGHLP